MKNHKLRDRFVFIGAAIDSFLFSFLAVLPLLSFFGTLKRLSAVLLVSGVFIAVLLFRMKGEQYLHIKKKRERAEEEYLERLLLMDDKTIGASLNREDFVFIRKADPDMFDILDAVRKGADAVGTIRLSKTAANLLSKYAPEISVIGLGEMIDAVFPDVSYRRHKYKKAFPSILMRSGKYWLLGVVLFVLSFVLRHKIYFRILSSASMIIALVLGIFNVPNRWKNLRIFLDNQVHR